MKSTKTTTNATKTNQSVDFTALYDALNNAKTKNALITAMYANGYYTSTKPTTTANTNDLYIQFIDKSRLLFSKRTIKLYTCESIASSKYFKSIGTHKPTNDGSYRKVIVSVENTLDNFNKLFQYFALSNKLGAVLNS